MISNKQSLILFPIATLILFPLIIDTLDAFQPRDAEIQCRENFVLVYRINSVDYVCVTESTAQRWVSLGIAEFVGDEEKSESMEPQFPIGTIGEYPIPAENDRVMSYVVRFSGGEFEDVQTFTTFSRYQGGDDLTTVKIIKDVGLDSYFILQSLPSKDKAEYYELLSRYMNPGKEPELFDVEIDAVTGDGTVLGTANYNKCKAGEYFTYSQEFTFIYQFSKKDQIEIRDQALFYCGGLNVEIFGIDESKNIDIRDLNPIPDDERALSYTVHFFDGEFEQVYTLDSFSKFSPSINEIETPYITITGSGNPFDSAPQFFLESLPSKDKREFYKVLSRYINPVKLPEPFRISVDLVTGDGTILQRWNYANCELTSYTMHQEQSFFRFPFAEKPDREIRDKSDFGCAGVNLEVYGTDKIPETPIKDVTSIKDKAETANTMPSSIPSDNERAQSYLIHILGGELEQVYASDSFPSFRGLAWNRGPLTPLHHDKQYEFGFVLESLPSKDKTEAYEFLSRYVNPGKEPEPFDVKVDVLTGDGTILQTLEYFSCEAAEVDWYLQEFNFIYQFSGKQLEEIRERYTVYCQGHTLDIP